MIDIILNYFNFYYSTSFKCIECLSWLMSLTLKPTVMLNSSNMSDCQWPWPGNWCQCHWQCDLIQKNMCNDNGNSNQMTSTVTNTSRECQCIELNSLPCWINILLQILSTSRWEVAVKTAQTRSKKLALSQDGHWQIISLVSRNDTGRHWQSGPFGTANRLEFLNYKFQELTSTRLHSTRPLWPPEARGRWYSFQSDVLSQWLALPPVSRQPRRVWNLGGDPSPPPSSCGEPQDRAGWLSVTIWFQQKKISSSLSLFHSKAVRPRLWSANSFSMSNGLLSMLDTDRHCHSWTFFRLRCQWRSPTW